MNDDVSVAELLEREGWNDGQSNSKSRFRVIAVMLAVVLGCGLAALLVHLGSQDPEADAPGPSVFNLPHGPTGGLAGGGVPSSQTEPEVTGTNSSVVVTNEAEAGSDDDRIPWVPRHRTTSTRTVTVTESSTPPSDRGEPTVAPTSDSPSNPANPPASSSPSRPANPTSCIIIIIPLC